MRILILIVIGLLLYVIIGNLIRKKKKLPRSTSDLGEMVRCQHCGLHILEQEAIREGGNYFCSQEHLEARQKNK